MGYSEEFLTPFRKLSKLINKELNDQLKAGTHKHFVSFNKRRQKNNIFDPEVEKTYPEQLRYNWDRANCDNLRNAQYRLKIQTLPPKLGNGNRVLSIGSSEIQIHFYGSLVNPDGLYNREFDVSSKVPARTIIGSDVPRHFFYFFKDASAQPYDFEPDQNTGEPRPISLTKAIYDALWVGEHEKVASIVGGIASNAMDMAKASANIEQYTKKLGR